MIHVDYYKRNFVGNRTGPQVLKNITIGGNSQIEMQEKLWDNAKPFIKREILVQTDGDDQITASWSDIESPTKEEIDKFLILQDQKSKRNLTPSCISIATLRAARNKKFSVLVHVFSKNVTSQAVWNNLKSNFLNRESGGKDGGYQDEAVKELAQLLQEKNVHRLTAPTFLPWKQFARYIMKQDISERDKLIQELPPTELMHLFRTIPTNEAIILDRTHHQIVVAKNVNESHNEDLAKVEECLKNVKATMTLLLQQVAELELRVDAMKSVANGNDRLISAIDLSLQPVETEASLNYADSVTDTYDFDHNFE